MLYHSKAWYLSPKKLGVGKACLPSWNLVQDYNYFLTLYAVESIGIACGWGRTLTPQLTLGTYPQGWAQKSDLVHEHTSLLECISSLDDFWLKLIKVWRVYKSPIF